MLRKIIRFILYGFVLICLLLGLFLFFLTIHPGETLIKNTTEKQLSDILNQQVQIGELETNLFSRFQIRHLRISKERKDFANLRLARINYNLFDLLRRKISIRSIFIDSLQVYVLRDSLGQFNLPVLDSTQTKQSEIDTGKNTFNFQIENILVQNSAAFYQDNLIPLNAKINNLNFKAKGEQENSFDFQALVDSITLQYKQILLSSKNLSLTGSLNSEQFELSSLYLRLPGLQFTGKTKIHFGDSSKVAGEFKLTGSLDSLAGKVASLFPPEILPLKGKVDLVAKVGGLLEDPRVSVNMEIPKLQAADLSIKNILLKSSIFSNSFAVEGFQFDLLGGRVEGQGSGGLDSSSFNRFDLHLTNLDLAQVLKFVYQQPSNYKGKINGSFFAEGNGFLIVEDWKSNADMILSELTYNSKFIPDIKNVFSFNKGKGSFHFKQDISEGNVDVRLDKENYQGEFSVAIFDISPLAGLANFHDLMGQVELNGNFSGTADSPVLDVNFVGRKIRYLNFPVDSVTGAIQYKNEILTINNTNFSGGYLKIDSTNSPFYVEGLLGGFSYEGSANGTLEDLKAQVGVQLNQPGFDTFVFNQGQIVGTMENNKIQVKSFVDKDSLLIFAKTNFDINSLNGDLDLDIYSFFKDSTKNQFFSFNEINSMNKNNRGNLFADFDLSDSTNWRISSNGNEIEVAYLKNILSDTLDLGGLLQYNLNFTGTSLEPSIQLSTKIKNPRFELVEIDSTKANLSFEKGIVLLDRLEFFYKQEYSWVQASVGLNKNKEGVFQVDQETEISGAASGNQFDLQILNPFLPGESSLSGYGTYRLDWNGTIGAPKILGNFDLTQGGFKQKDQAPILNQVTLQAILEDSLVTFKNSHGNFWETPWNFEGQIKAKNWQDFFVDFNLNINDKAKITSQGWIYKDSLNLNSRIQNFDLAVLQSSLQEISNLQGGLNASVDVRGLFENPHIIGNLYVRNLAMMFPEYNSNLTNGLIKMSFDKQTVKIDSVFSKINEGTFLLQGNVKQEQLELTDANLKANLKNIKITRPKEAIVDLTSARINYSRRNDYFLLDGDIILGETKMIYNLRPQDFISFSQSVEKPPQELPAILQKTRIDIRLRESDKIWIDNNLARIRMHSELGLIGSPANLNVTGRLSLEEGYVLYLDRKFKINKGVIDFIDPNRLNPIIDLESQATLKSYQTLQGTAYNITLSIKGPLDQVVVDFVSDPPLEKSDIVSLLTIGATREQLTSNNSGGTESSVSTVLLERAKALSSARIAGYAERKLGDLFGLDKMTIEGNLFQFNKTWGPQLLASKKLSDRVTLIYSTVVGHMNEQSVRLDYRLTKKFSVEGQTDQQGNSGLDLKYRIKFK